MVYLRLCTGEGAVALCLGLAGMISVSTRAGGNLVQYQTCHGAFSISRRAQGNPLP